MDFHYKVLIIEDDQSICHYISSALESNGYDGIVASNGRDAKALASSHCPDVILLDMGLPDIDGMSVLNSVRSWSQVPVIVVSSRGTEEDKVSALENGADDYIVKPFGLSELLARIAVALRHSHSGSVAKMQNKCIIVGDMVIDYDKCRVTIRGKDAELTQNEFRIVALLGENVGRVITYDEIIKRLWGPNAVGSNQILRVNIANIRRKIEEVPSEPKYIITATGIGYRLADSDEQ